MNTSNVSELNQSGIQLAREGRLHEALKTFIVSLTIDPNQSTTLNNLGMIYTQLGQHHRAIEIFKKALKLSPNLAESHFNLGNIYHQQSEFELSIHHYQLAIQLQPNFIMALNNLGIVYQEQGEALLAIQTFQQALSFKPNFVLCLNNLGLAFRSQGQMSQAINTYQKALELKSSSEIYNGLAISLMDSGQTKQALNYFKQAIQLNPDDWETRMNFLLCLTYQSDLLPQTIFEYSEKWGKDLQKNYPQIPPVAINQIKQNQRLRIAYVSPDFRQHSAQYLIEGLLQHHNSEHFEVFCYADVKHSDQITLKFQSMAENWRFTSHLNHQQLAQAIQEDNIQILIDLAGHTSNNRLAVFALKPAPIQVSYYPMSTGLNTIDYRIADELIITDITRPLNTEQLLFISRGYMCFSPPANRLKIGSIPSNKNDHITFGSFSNLAKINPQVISVWSNILKSIPNSRLILKYKAFKDPEIQNHYFQQFKAQGISPERIRLMGWLSSQEHLELYNQIDIALDPFPFNGHITSCEALWMGVPVITLEGQCDFGRSGLSILSRVGFPELIAKNIEDYIQLAIQLAQNTDIRTTLRSTLREKLYKSSLCQLKPYVKELEQLYLKIWQEKMNNPSIES